MEGRIEKNTDSSEISDVSIEKSSSKEVKESIKNKYDNLFSDDYNSNLETTSLKISEQIENSKEQEMEENKKQDNGIQAVIFSEDFNSPENDEIKVTEASEVMDSDTNETKLERKNKLSENITRKIGTVDGIKEFIEEHPEKKELIDSALKAINRLKDSDISDVEIRRAQAKLSNLKGQLFEIALKDELKNLGFDVESKQRIVEGENGATKPDVIAVNNTDYPIGVGDITVAPGETISFECKCGGASYIQYQFKYHISNQLSGHEGIKVLISTSDIRDVPRDLVDKVCIQYNANLLVLDVRVAVVETAIKEVAKNENISN